MGKFAITAQVNLLPPRNLRQVANQIHNALAGGTTPTSSANSPLSPAALAKTNAQLKATAAAATQTAKAVKGTGQAFDAMGKSVLTATKRFAAFALGSTAIVTLAATMRKGLADGIAFQHGMTRLSQLTGKSTSQLKGLSDEIHGLASGLGVSSRGLADVSDTLVQAGLSAKDTKIALAALAKTNLSPTFGSMNETVEASIALMGQFGTGADKLERQLGSINAVSAKFAVESSDITQAIRIAGGSFKQAGGNLNELLALFTSVRSKTRESASSIGHAFQTIFARLQRPGTHRQLKDLLGIDLAEGGKFVGPLEAIHRLHDAMEKLPQGSLLAAKVGEVIGGVRQLSKVIPLIKEFDTTLDALRVAQMGENSLTADTIAAQSSLQVQLTKTGEAWKKFADDLVGSQGFQSAVKDVLSLTRGLADLSHAVIPLIPTLAALGGLKAAGKLLGGGTMLSSRLRPHGYAVIGRAILTGRSDWLKPGLARGVARFGGTALAVGGAYAASAAGDALGNYVGGDTGKYISHGVSGAAGGALIGASIGSILPGVGTALGAVAGAAYGLVSSFEDARRDINAAKLKGAFDALERQIDRFGKVDMGIGGFRDITRRTLEAHNALQVRRMDELSNVGYQSEAAKGIRVSYARQDTELARQANDAFEKYLRSHGGMVGGAESAQIIRARARVRTAELTEKYQIEHQDRPIDPAWIARTMETFVKDERRKFEAERKTAAATRAFTRAAELSADGIGRLTGKLRDLADASDNRNALSLGVMGTTAAAVHYDRTSSSIARFGSQGFEDAAKYLGRVSPSLSRSSALLMFTNRAHNAMSEALPSLLNGRTDLGTDEGKDVLRTGIANAMDKHKVAAAVRKRIMGELDSLENTPDFAATFGSGTANSELTEKLLSWSKSIRAAEQEAAKGIEDNANKLTDSLGKLMGIGDDVIASRHAKANIVLAGRRFLAERKAFNQGGDVTSHLSVGQAQLPFRQHLQALTGLAGNAALSPRSIMAVYAQARQGMLAAEGRVAKNPADAKSVAELRVFENQTQRAVAALRHLADASKLNASLQERLAALDRDKVGRLGFAEQFATASPAEQMQMGRNAALAAQAVRGRSLKNFSLQERQGILEHFNATASVRQFGTELTGEDYKRRLLQRDFPEFGPNAKDRAESAKIEKDMAGNHGRAADAQSALTGILENTQRDFFNSLEANQRAFLQALGGTLGKNVVLPKQREVALQPRPARGGGMFSIHDDGALPPTTFPPISPSAMPSKKQAAANRRKINQQIAYHRSRIAEILPFAGKKGNGHTEDLQEQVNAIAGLKRELNPPNPKRQAYLDERQRRKAAYTLGKEGRLINSAGFRRMKPEQQQEHIDAYNKAADKLAGPMNTFGQHADQLGKSLAAFPHELKVKGEHNVNVVINGAEALAKMQPEILKMVTDTADAVVREKLNRAMPELGIHNV